MAKRIKAADINVLKRYKLIRELYNTYKSEDIPVTKVLKNHIYPVYPISRATLYKAIDYPLLDAKIRELEAIKAGGGGKG